jgi:hypothetical protein
MLHLVFTRSGLEQLKPHAHSGDRVVLMELSPEDDLLKGFPTGVEVLFRGGAHEEMKGARCVSYAELVALTVTDSQVLSW